MKRFSIFVLLAFVLTPWCAAAGPVEHELGHGLVYTRVRSVPADLPAKPAGRVPPCIIDVRYLEADAAAATAFGAWLKFRATPRSPVFVLANGETSSELLKLLAAHETGTGIVVVGIETARFRPDVAVKSTAADERRAYDAFEKGVALATLTADNPKKVRNDEASLNRPSPAPAATTNEAEPGVLIDLTLQRAVHLHRALVALKKI